MIRRALSEVFPHFSDKIIVVYGPRQAGKTTLIEQSLHPTLTLNMDSAQDRRFFKRCPEALIDWYRNHVGSFPQVETRIKSDRPLIFLDEIHKVKGWRDLLKASYDKTRHALCFVASGSSAFGLRRQDKGDSLAGRAVWFPLFPVSFREYVQSFAPDISLPSVWQGQSSLIESMRPLQSVGNRLHELWSDYARFGSFPENLIKRDAVFYDQWLRDYAEAMLNRDLKDLGMVKDVERVYHVFQLLIEGLGSTYSLNSIARTLSVSPNTVKQDILALHQVLWSFELPVAVLAKSKQIRKEKKFYPFDFCFTHYQDSMDEGARFECTVACLLYRNLYTKISGLFPKLFLGFFRDYQKREVDFVVRDKKRVLLGVECKRKMRAETGQLALLSQFTPSESLLVVEEPGVFSSVDRHRFAVSIELFAAALA